MVKIGRPNVSAAVKADLNVITDSIKDLPKRQGRAKTPDLHGVFGEFGQSILSKLN